MAITDAKDLGRAIKNGQDEIVIEGNLAKKTIKIKATGKVAWAIAIGGITTAVIAGIATAGTAGTAAPATLPAVAAGFSMAAPAVGGISVASSAVNIAIAAGGVGALNKLRKYEIVEKSDNRVVLRRK